MNDNSVQAIVLDSGLDMCKIFQIAEASQSQSQIRFLFGDLVAEP
jgi:hypothetical protein